MNNAIVVEIEKVYLDSVDNGIFSKEQFNQEMIKVWKDNRKSLAPKKFISIVAEVLGPCVHYVDFSKIVEEEAA